MEYPIKMLLKNDEELVSYASISEFVACSLPDISSRVC